MIRDLPRPPPIEPYTPHVRPARRDDMGFVFSSWREGYKSSPDMHRKSWPDYKALHVPMLRQCLEREDTRVMVAVGPSARLVGWIAFARWPSVDTVHWLYVAMPHRRRDDRTHGVCSALLAGAELRGNVVYTHRGPRTHNEAERSDLRLAALLAARGTTVSYIPYAEWSK